MPFKVCPVCYTEEYWSDDDYDPGMCSGCTATSSSGRVDPTLSNNRDKRDNKGVEKNKNDKPIWSWRKKVN